MKKALEDFTGTLGIGYLFSLGLFLLMDSSYKIHSSVQHVSTLKTWEILAAIPLLMVIYIIGIVVIELSEIILPGFFFKKTQKSFSAIIAKVVKHESELLQTRYLIVLQHRRILNAGFLAFLVAGIGSYLDGVIYSEKTKLFGLAGLIVAIILAIGCPLISVRVQKNFLNEIAIIEKEVSS